MRHIIIGAGPAGVTAAETLRKLDINAEITVYGDEREPPYSRMAIPYLLMDKVGEDGTYLREKPTHFQGLGIGVGQVRVTGVDAQQHQITLENGETQGYDKLLIATGSSPIKPPIPGISAPNVFNCWTLEDARAIQNRVAPGSRVVLIGAGFIGSIVLEALAMRGAKLTVIEMGERMVPRMMGPHAGNLLRTWCESKGVEVHTGIGVKAITPEGDGLRLTLSNDGSIMTDAVITATGVRPNIDFLEGSGIKVDQGILVDRHFCTNLPDVYAAGDVAQGLDFSTGDHEVQAIQPTATDHGQLAALNMNGQVTRHEGALNMNVLDTLGLLSCSFGLWMGVEGGDHAELYQPEYYRYLSLQFDGDRLVGANAVGLSQHVGVLRGLIQRQTHLGVWKERLMEDPTRVMEAYIATTQVV